jgi:LemA protein
MIYLVPLTILIALALALLALGTALYNSLVRLDNACNESWSEIDLELRRRYDLVPSLVETIKGYARHERNVLERVSQARDTAAANQGSPASRAEAENVLVACLDKMSALAEDFPDLQTVRRYIDLREELAAADDRLRRARRSYNASVRDLNNRLEGFPANIVAGMFALERRGYFELDDPAALKTSTDAR